MEKRCNVACIILVLSFITTVTTGCNQPFFTGALPAKNPPVTYMEQKANTAEIRANTNRIGRMGVAVEYQPHESSVGDEEEVIQQTNAERQKVGLLPLKVNQSLMNMARIKAWDMVNNHYFDHRSATYGSPFTMMAQSGIPFTAAGENIAGNTSVSEAMRDWLSSTGHRANLLNEQYAEIGVGVVEGGPYGKMFVQEFIHP